MRQHKEIRNDEEDPSDKVTSEQSSEGTGGTGRVDLGGQSVPCTGNSEWQQGGRALPVLSHGRVGDQCV